MRPLLLKLQGLRSYREEQEVDFEGVNLVAIVGDTGAGKSSLLEGITVALYGTSTWDGKETKSLISDGSATMQVSLTFRADGKVWRVERAVSRTTYPPARHSLECIDAGERADRPERLDKKEAVDAKIRQLVGLDYDAFLRSVVLPQGRFAALLQAKQAERASILKGILRIDRLDAVREQAREARDRMVPVVDSLRERRSKLISDPEAAERDAAQRLAAADLQRIAAKEARRKVGDARQAARAAEDRRRTLEDLAARAASGRVNGASAVLRLLAEREAEIQAALAANEASTAVKRGEEDELAATIDEAEKKGAGPQSLAHARSDLSLIADELPLVSADAAALEKDEVGLAKDTADLEKALTMTEAFVAAETEAKAALSERQTEARRAAESLEDARRSLKELRTAETEEAKAAKKADKARADEAKAKEDLEAATADAKKAEAKFEEAESASRAAAQKHAAHDAAAGSKAGDPCPVCERPLPDGFKAPRAPAIESANKKLDKAKKDHDAAREKLALSRSRAEAQAEKAHEAGAELAERSAHTTDTRGRLTASVGASPPTTIPADDAAVLAPLAARKETASRALAEAEAHAQKARDVVVQAKAAVDGTKKHLKERRDALEKAKDALAARRKRLGDAAQRLPADLRPREPFQTTQITELLARVELRKLKIEKVARDLDDARAARRALETERTRLTEQRQREVVAKATELDVQLATFAERLSRLAEALPDEPPAPRPEGAPLSELAEWATGFEGAADALLASGKAAAEAARAAFTRAEEEARAALAEAGADSEAALDSALARIEGLCASATADLERAIIDKPLAAALDGRIERANGLLLALTEVTRLVADGKLVQHVVHRRQRVLLAVASELLGSMTRKRYGFSEDFEVVDRLSGQARGTRTLSGGETFLASLALSLALVELAGRAGGRLEALFLDEGFGSLDASCLGEALDALGQKAEGGRLVAVISHLKSVAESIDRVLAVKATPAGSRVAWISAEERERMLSEDVERGLIS